ncbi:MAG: DNA-processing protein DprA [Thermomicrobiales bacterium]
MSALLNLDDRIATIAACSTVGRLERPAGRSEPLGPAEWSEVAQWLHERTLTPASLLDMPENLAAFPGLKLKLASRLIDLPARAALVSLELEQFANRGIWSVVRFDQTYPQPWRDKLKRLAPPVVFGAGQVDLLNRSPSVAIVGSRDIDEELADLASAIGRRAAASGYLVASGGARGSDRWGMFGALNHSGAAVGILHGDLAKDAGNQNARQFVEDGLLCLTSHVHPSTGFVTGNAMARNRYIHAFADATVVIATAENTGGTWQGSIDNLEQLWSPLLVWVGAGAPDGNHVLAERGALPFTRIPEDTDQFAELISAADEHRKTSVIHTRPVQAEMTL